MTNRIFKEFSVETKAIDLEAGIFEIIISTEEIDRQGDIVRATGAQLTNYLRNPVVLLGHDYHDFPIGRTLAIEVMPGRGLKARFQFPEWGMYDKADTTRKLFAAGFINAASIGFMPLESLPLEKDRPWGPQDYVSWEMLEWSLVTVPANASALRLSFGKSPVESARGLVIQLLTIESYLEKRGRVLSAANERKLRDAAEAITSVLAQLENSEPEEESLEELAAKDHPEGTKIVRRLCSKCTKPIEMTATLALEVKLSGKEPLCQDCLIKSDPGIGDGTPSPVTDPVTQSPNTDPTENDWDEAVLESLSELMDAIQGAQ